MTPPSDRQASAAGSGQTVTEAPEAVSASQRECSVAGPARPDLHSHALELVFAALPFTSRLTSLPLVCKDWHGVLRRSGLHWRYIELDGHRVEVAPAGAGAAPEFWARVLAWFAPRGAAVRRLAIENFRGPVALPTPADTAATMRSLFALLPGLQHLNVTRSTAAMCPGALAAATTLRALRTLRVELSGPLHTQDIDSLACLPLRELSICLIRTADGNSRFEGPFPASLTRLHTLERLVLEGPYSGHNATRRDLPDGIAAWKQMTHLRLKNLGLGQLPAAIGALQALEALCLGHNLLGERPFDCLPESLAQLTRLRRLELPYNQFEAGLPELIGSLTGLEELDLSGNHWGTVQPDLPPAFSRLRLGYLSLTNCSLTALPAVAAGMRGLVLLKVNINALRDLPAGPYLETLEMLDLAHNRFDGYPPALLRAPKLRGVAFQHNGVHYTDPALAAQHAAPPALPLVPAAAAALLAVEP